MIKLVGRNILSRRHLVTAVVAGTVTSLAGIPPLSSGAAVIRPDAQVHSPRPHSETNAFRQVNLVSDIEGMAQLTDPAVKNPWGIAFGPTTPLWVSNQFNPAFDPANPRRRDLRTKITLYSGGSSGNPITKIPLEVTASSPTGMVFNPTSRFVVSRDGATSASAFLWDESTFRGSPDNVVSGITGWSPNVPPIDHGVVRVHRPGAVDLGMALVRLPTGPRLLIANTAAGRIDMFNGSFRHVPGRGAFVDPNGAGLTPYNVAVLDHRVYVAYDAESGDDYAISVFTKDGRFIKRLVTGAPLDDAWGMAIAPPNWGGVGGDLLVGNVESGEIDAFNLHTGAFHGALSDANGDPIVNPGLWGIQFGNGVIGTPRTLIFAAGVGDEMGEHVYEHGLIGKIQPIHM